MKTWYYDKTWRTDPYARAQAARHFTERRGGETKYGVGHVVEYVKGNQHRCGVLLAHRRHFVRVLDQDGKERPVHQDKIVDVSSQMLNPWQPHDEAVAKLREIARTRDEIKDTLDARTLWELVSEGEPREWTLAELTDLYFREDPGADSRCALSRVLDDGHLFARRGQKFSPLRPERVAQHDEAEAKARREAEWFQQAGEWLRSVADGNPVAPPDDSERAIRLLEGEALFGTENPDAHQAARLTKLAHLHGPQAAFGALVKLGRWDEDENLDLLREEFPTTFSDEALAEAEACEWPQPALKASRLWLGRVYGLSRSGGDCERAISIRRRLFGGCVVGVHFASPALMVAPDGHVEAEARERGVSVRLPDRIIRMIPAAVATKLRLTTEELRPTLTVEVRLDSRLRVQDHSIRLRRVRLSESLTFDDADARIGTDARLGKLHDIAQKLRQARRETGAIIIPEPGLELAVRDKEIDLRLVEPGSASRLIWDELRVLANSLAGEFCRSRQLPALHRVEEPVSDNLIRSDDYDPVASREQKRLMPRARLQVEPGRHSGLGVDHYAPIDRPLHRYTDFLMQRQLLSFFASRGAPLLSTKELGEALLHTAWAREAGTRIERSAERYWLLKYLERSVGKEMEAVVLERRPRGCLVELCECLQRAFVAADRDVRFAPGDRVLVTLRQVSARRDELQLARPRRTD